ncbi:MAG: hypothetical protein WC353_04465 [Candidatus Peribacter sp.]
MPPSPEPTAAERTIMMRSALSDVRTAQARIALERQEEAERAAEPAEESLRPKETIRFRLTPGEPVMALRQKFPEQYRAILRAAARTLEPDPQTRQKLYAILHCAPEDQP